MAESYSDQNSCHNNYFSIFRPLLSSIISQEVSVKKIAGFQEYNRIVNEYFDDQGFNIIINIDEEAHDSLTLAAATANTSSKTLPFFLTEDESKEYLSDKMQEKENS